MRKMERKLKDIAARYIDKTYSCSRPEMACIFLALDILAPLSTEFSAIRGRLKCLEITASKGMLIHEDYFYKFIRTTRLKLRQVKGGVAELAPGDVLLLNKKSKDGKVDHLALYLGGGDVVMLNVQSNEYVVNLLHINDIQSIIKAIARGKLDG